jgi:hypothetical protein
MSLEGDWSQPLPSAVPTERFCCICSGVIIAEAILRSTASIDGRDWGYLILLYIFVQLARAMVIGICFPLLTRMGYGLDWKEVRSSTERRLIFFLI